MSAPLDWLRQHQRGSFLFASGLSTAGSFAGLTTKGWILLQGSNSPLLLAVHFAVLALPSLVVSGWAGVATDRHGSERVLIWAQWGLFAAAVLGAVAIPLTAGTVQLVMLLSSTLLMGLASAYELTARNKYCALLVEEPEQLAPYLASFSVVFNLGKLVGPPLGGWLVAVTDPGVALAIDAASYLIPIAVVVWLLQPQRGLEIRSQPGQAASLGRAWQEAGPKLRHVIRFAAVACLACFFHPALAPLMARDVLGPTPQALGLFTGVLAAGSIAGGMVVQRHSRWLSERPALLLGGCTGITGLAQLVLAVAGLQGATGVGLMGTFVIGAGTAALLAGVNMISQVGAPLSIRGRMAGLGQIAFLGGGGASGLMAALITMRAGMESSFAVLGMVAVALGAQELVRRGGMRLRLRSA